MTRLLLAPAGHGKTETVIQLIRNMLAEEPLTSVIVVVPNAIQARNFKQRLSAAGGALGVDVHTFYTLYAELLTRAGQPIPLLLDSVRIRLLQSVVDQLCEQGKIKHYAALQNKPGFVSTIRNVIEELKRARIYPHEFTTATNGLGARLEEIARIYSEYQDWLQKQNWADNEGRGWLAALALESNPELGTDTRLLTVTGFDEFNPTQLGVLSLLARRAKETIITLTGDMQNPQRNAHHRFRRAQTALIDSLKIQPEAMDSSSMLFPAIAEIESSLFENQKSQIQNRKSQIVNPKSQIVNPKSQIEFLEAQTRALETRAALRWIKARVIRDGMNLNEVAVIARDIEIYRPFLEEIASEFNIPIRFVSGQRLAENPAVSALLAALSIPVENWKRGLTLGAWRSPYFDWTAQGLTPEVVAALDEISFQGKVIQGLEQWRESFEMWEKKKTITNEDGISPLPLGEGSGVRESFEAFIEALTPPNRASVSEYVAFIESLIGDDPALTPSPSPEGRGGSMVACARENESTAERDVKALQAFKDVLRGLVLAESALETDEIAYAEFFKNLRAATDAATYSVYQEAGMLAASVLEARGLSMRAIALMGLSEGEFPKREREDILLRESDRAILRQRGLSLETKLHGDEATFFYQAVTRAREKLLLTRPYLADDGQAWEASPFWVETLQRGNGIHSVVKIRSEDGGVDSVEAASQVEWVESAREFDIQIQNGIEVLKARMNPTARGIYEGETFNLSERFNAALGWSASRLESYGTCPFDFFVGYALGLEPREEPEEGFDARMFGSMLHKILEDVYDGADLNETARKVFSTAPQEYGFRPTPLWDLQQKEFIRMLEKSVAALNEASGGFAPHKTEAKFGMGNPSLVLKTSAGDVRLHGYIDRLDVAPDGSLRVIDYKAGSAAITANHLKEGRRLQLPIYALAARDALGLGKISSGFYWHIQKAEASSLKLEKFEGGIEVAFETAIAHVGKHVANIRAGHFEPKPPDEGCPSYCPAVNFCWRYKKGF